MQTALQIEGKKTLIITSCGHVLLSNAWSAESHTVKRLKTIRCCTCQNWCFSDYITPGHAGYKDNVKDRSGV